MAGSVDEAESIDSALLSASGGVSAVWGAGGGLSLGPSPRARVTRALSNAVARLARELSWQVRRGSNGLNWKTVAGIVKRAGGYGCGIVSGRRVP